MSLILNFVTFAVLTVLGITALCIQVWALSDCLRTPASAFQSTNKRSKAFWGGLTGVATFFGFLYVLPALSLISPSFGMGMIFNLAAVTVAGVYLADVKPAVAEVRGRGRGNQNRGPSW